MLKLDTETELEALHTSNVKEGLHLEYKASGAIDKRDDSKKLEMARDVSAFANADGGQVVYGMTEKDHEPAGLDQGIDAKAYPEICLNRCFSSTSRRASQASGPDTFH
jgi:predicted HTH transcriptional regulator